MVIGGNPDSLLDPQYVARFPDRICESEGQARADLNWHDIVYFNNSSTSIRCPSGRKINVFGSPWTQQYGAFAFQYPPIRDVWTGTVPDDTDILLTHGPPKGYLDLEGKGSPQLTREVARTRPRLVVFGHIHARHGREDVSYDAVERGYQAAMVGDGGVLNLLNMCFWLFVAWLRATVHLTSETSHGPRTTMVNAAVVKGFRNEESRPVITVEI